MLWHRGVNDVFLREDLWQEMAVPALAAGVVFPDRTVAEAGRMNPVAFQGWRGHRLLCVAS
ncbi:hypothetical protein AA21952_0196 [Acetobacter oeni LMG 21952]|nr:hypothetical protein AA21952_0196 [Acetobacter oeni LMG 21952]